MAYWEKRYGELSGSRPWPAGQLKVKPPLIWAGYKDLLERFQKGLAYQRRVSGVLRQEALGEQGRRVWLRGHRQPLVADNVGLAHEGNASLTYVDQLVVDEATLGSEAPTVDAFSTKLRDLRNKSPKEATAQVAVDAREARTKYGGTVEVRRPGHPLYARKVVVTRVHLVYEGEGLTSGMREALADEALANGVELHFYGH